MNKVSVEIIKDFDGSYYANIIKNDEYVRGLPEHVDYRTLKKAIKEKIGFEILPLKVLSFKRFGRKQSAYFKNYN